MKPARSEALIHKWDDVEVTPTSAFKRMRPYLVCAFLTSFFWPLPATRAGEVLVRTPAEFREAVARARPGTRVLLAPGEYPGGFHFGGLRGETNRPIVIAAADAATPPVFRGGSTALHFTDPANLELHDLVITGTHVNGLNIDDGGSFDSPAQHVVLRGLTVRDIGARGNQDAIKLSGLVHFRIEGCSLERWGSGGGSGIDMVGCHDGLVVSNLLRHSEGTGSSGVQCKGGTSRIRIQRNRFASAGARGVNIGGSTGLQFFRPPLKSSGQYSEARDLRVEGNTFFGGGAAVAFVGVDGAVVRFNTIFHPQRWAVRILQETTAPGFVPSRRGEFTDNLVVFRSDQWSEGGVNIGAGTDPASFQFARNWWYCTDRPDRSKPALPLPEKGGIYGVEPRFINVGGRDLRQSPESPARKVGADALPN
jgi:hypothetical protein